MYLTNLYIDRFGSCSNTQLEGLVDGLHVVFGPTGSGKATVLHFLRSMFTGFDADVRERYLTGVSRGAGGAVTIQTPSGRHTISRHDDGGREGRLTVERPDGAVISRRQLQDLIGNVTPSLLSSAFFVDFDRRPTLQELLRHASACGLSVTQENRIPERHRLLEREIAEAEQHVADLRVEIHKIEQLLSDLADQRKATRTTTLPTTNIPTGLSHEQLELREIEAKLAVWKRTLNDIVKRKQQAAEACDALQAAAEASGRHNVDPRRSLHDVESDLQQLQKALEQLTPKAGQPCQCEVKHAALSESLTEVREHVYRLCKAFNHWEAQRRYREAIQERDQSARCEFELREAIRSLSERRRRMIEQASPWDQQTTLHPDHDSYCECDDHPRMSYESLPANSNEDLTEIESEINRLANVRLKRLAEVAEWETELAERQAELSRLRLTKSTIISEASDYLRRLSAGDWHRIQTGGEEIVSVENNAGEYVTYNELDAGTQDQVYLAICLAIATAHERRGGSLPIVLNAAFTQYPSKHVRSALEFLKEFGRGRQVVCLTRYEHVASVARMLNVPVHSLVKGHHGRHVVERVERMERYEPEEVEMAGDIWRTEPARPSYRSQLAFADERVRPPHRSPSSPHTTSELNRPSELRSASSIYHLHEHDPIEKTPGLDSVNANRLRRVGLLRVGDLLRVPPSDVADDLQESGVTIDMVESWRAQAKLVCHIPGLRPYDARILVCCGIREPEQLMQMRASVLRTRVKEFASSAEGQALLMSGTEFELSRLTEWISPGREALVNSVALEAEPMPAKPVPNERPRKRRARSAREAA